MDVLPIRLSRNRLSSLRAVCEDTAVDEEVVYAVEGTRLRSEASLRALAIAKPCQSLLK